MNTTQIPKKAAERRAWIKYQLELQGLSLAALARAHGYYRTAAVHALDRQYPQMEAIIANALGVRPCAIWPERYDRDGRPLKRQKRVERSKRPSLSAPMACSNQEGEA